MSSAKLPPFCLGLNVLTDSLDICQCDSLFGKRQRDTYPDIATSWTPRHYTRNMGVVAPILGVRPANERRRYKVTPFLTGWAQT